jgi:hypothetical protein
MDHGRLLARSRLKLLVYSLFSPYRKYKGTGSGIHPPEIRRGLTLARSSQGGSMHIEVEARNLLTFSALPVGTGKLTFTVPFICFLHTVSFVPRHTVLHNCGT